jgi:hypothetical protein
MSDLNPVEIVARRGIPISKYHVMCVDRNTTPSLGTAMPMKPK